MKTLLLICFVFLASLVLSAQEVKIDGKVFQTVKKTVLNDKTEYYQLKEKGKPGATKQSYIKTGGGFHKTVFTETELKDFFRTGKVSDLGKMEIGTVRDSLKIKYINKGGKKIFVSVNGNRLKVYEYNGGLEDMFISSKKAGNDSPRSPEETSCIETKCEPAFNDCQSIIVHEGSDEGCYSAWLDCVCECELASRNGANLFIRYVLPINVDKIIRY